MTKTRMKLHTTKLLLSLVVIIGVLACRIHGYVHDIEEAYGTNSDMPSPLSSLDQRFENNGYEAYAEPSDYESLYNYGGIENEKRSSRIHVYRRGCIPRNGNCGLNWPKECCYNSSCRCNLWGTNCRCQRMGLFQKWG